MLTIDADGLDSTAESLRELAARVNRDVVQRVIEQVQNEIKVNLQGEILKVRTGGLLRSWSQPPVVREESGEVVGTLRSNSPYAAIHEFGGVIRPVRSQNLTIPLRGALSAAGRTKFRAWEVFLDPSAYGFRHVWINRARTAILGVPPGKKRQVVPLFSLRKEVTMPARHYISDAIRTVEARTPEIVRDVTLRVAQAMGLLAG